MLLTLVYSSTANGICVCRYDYYMPILVDWYYSFQSLKSADFACLLIKCKLECLVKTDLTSSMVRENRMWNVCSTAKNMMAKYKSKNMLKNNNKSNRACLQVIIFNRNFSNGELLLLMLFMLKKFKLMKKCYQ